MRNWKKIVASAFALFALADLPAHASAIGEIEQRFSTRTTYSCTTDLFTPLASATDMAQLFGSGTKTVKLLRIYISYTTASAANQCNTFYVIKRSTANSSGTPTTPTVIPVDSNNAAGTAVVKYYASGSNPTTGTTVGTLVVAPLVAATSATSTSQPPQSGMFLVYDADQCGQTVVLRGTGEGVVINNNGATLTGTSAKVSVTYVWTEE